jgi:hypothetical protein
MALYAFQDVKSRSKKPVVIRELIENELSRDDGVCYAAMERMLMGNYSGSPQFDHAYAVDVLLHFDAQNGKDIATNMEANSINRRQLWDILRKVLERYYIFKGAVMVEPRLEYSPETEQSA